MYAVVRTGGKQYRVEPGQRLKVEKLPGAIGDAIELTDVLMVATDEGVTIGAPTVADMRVVAEVAEQGRDRKVDVFKYKSKIRYRRFAGHRQHHTVLLIKEFSGPGITPPKKRPTKSPESKDVPEEGMEAGAPEAEVPTPVEPEAVVEAADPGSVVEAAERPARKRPARKAAAKKATKAAKKTTTSAKKATKPTAAKKAAKKVTKKAPAANKAAKKAAKKAPARKRPTKDKGD